MNLRLIQFILLGFLSIGSHAQTSVDVENIKAKLYQISLGRSLIVEMEVDLSMGELIKGMDISGQWPDIDYQDKTASRWIPAMHLKRIFELAIQYRDEKSLYYGDRNIRDLILKGIQFWVNDTPQATNYWWNAIGAANLLGGIFILMENELDDTLLMQGVELMKVGVKPTYYEYHGKATGQNLLWVAYAHLYASCLTDDTEGLKRIFSSVSKEIMITNEEGIQPDYSFYQHGRQNYAWGYGKGFAATSVQYLYLATHTAYQFPQEKINIISRYLLDGLQWMSRYNVIEYTAMGRELSRPRIDRSPILNSLKWMIEIDPLRKKEYLAFYNRLSGQKQEKSLVGNRYFWRSDLMVHHRENYYFSLKATSNRIKSGESGNGENIKGYYQGNGTFYLVRNGHEYDEIFPVWDWRKLPGSLSPQSSEPIPLFNWGRDTEGATSFVYGISDGLYGCFAYDYFKDMVRAKRAWFFFDNEILNLVCEVSGDSLFQSINQSVLNGEIWSEMRNPNSKFDRVHHDSVGYFISTADELVVKNKKKTGAWKDINLAASDQPITKEVFSLGINLGEKVSGSIYFYVILPGISLPQFKTYKFDNHIQVLQNSHSVQAVYHKDLEQVQAIFYTKDQIELPWNKIIIEVENPGLLIFKKSENKLTIDYSQPVLKKHLELEINKLHDSKIKIETY